MLTGRHALNHPLLKTCSQSPNFLNRKIKQEAAATLQMAARTLALQQSPSSEAWRVNHHWRTCILLPFALATLVANALLERAFGIFPSFLQLSFD